jgi:outer membrane protein assembly factor BamA
MRRPGSGLRAPACWASALAVALGSLLHAQPTDLIGVPIAEVRVEQEGRPVTERLILGLIATEIGEPLSMRDVRDTIDHLNGLGRFDDVQVFSERSGTGVAVSYVLVPRHAVQSVTTSRARSPRSTSSAASCAPA